MFYSVKFGQYETSKTFLKQSKDNKLSNNEHTQSVLKQKYKNKTCLNWKNKI